jgi:exodeoxyribonuclease VII large subunit
MRYKLEHDNLLLYGMQQHLAHLDPRQVLARGYSMVRDEHGAIVTKGETLQPGKPLEIVFAQGWAIAEVREAG